MPPNFSLVVPVYNEEESLDALVAAVEPLAPAEAIFVDDGSTDASWERLRRLAAERPWMRLLRFEKNAGQSAAFYAGIQAAASEIVVTMDADLQNDPADIPRLLQKLAEADLVCGWRTRRHDSLGRRLASRLANAVRRFFTGDGVPDTGCSLKAFRRVVVPPWAYFRGLHRFLPAVAVMQGFRVVSVPVGHHPRRFGATKYGYLSRLWVGLADLVGVWWLRRRRLDFAIKERVR
jgi:glycosyltransferase involved in cell wall biosynthesis